MKKMSWFIALAGATLVPSLSWAAPQFYGKANVSVSSSDVEGAAFRSTPVDAWEVKSNSSRLGVKGAIDLDVEGLSAVYQVEYGVELADGAGAFTQRNSFVGLQDKRFGRLIAGVIDSPLKSIEGKVDQFNDLDGDIDYLLGGQNRLKNQLQYDTPRLAGLQLTLAAVPGEDSVDADGDGVADKGLADTRSVALTWQQGDWYAALAYDGHQEARNSLDGFTRADISRAVLQVTPGPLELGALVQLAKGIDSNNDGKDSSWLVSAAWNIEQVKLKAQYGQTKADVSDETLSLASLGVDYNLSKQVTAYVYGTRAERDLAETTDNRFGVGLVLGF